MNITVVLEGRTPLLMHNPRMADPQFELCREIKALTKIRNKTDEILRQIEKLEWYGGFYGESNGNGKQIAVQPTSKPRKCLINTGRITKAGKMVERAVSFAELNVPLIHDGPDDIDAIFTDPRFTSRLSVGVKNARVMRVRPQFPRWKLEVDGLFVEDAGLNFEDLERIVELAGLVEGIGDNRVNGYGRFSGKVIKR